MAEGDAKFIKVDGKAFICECQANVFTEIKCDVHNQIEYKCNGCGLIYG